MKIRQKNEVFILELEGWVCRKNNWFSVESNRIKRSRSTIRVGTVLDYDDDESMNKEM